MLIKLNWSIRKAIDRLQRDLVFVPRGQRNSATFSSHVNCNDVGRLLLQNACNGSCATRNLSGFHSRHFLWIHSTQESFGQTAVDGNNVSTRADGAVTRKKEDRLGAILRRDWYVRDCTLCVKVA